MSAPEFDLDFVRSHFPAFAEPSLKGWAFFENAGGSYCCAQVVERLSRYYTQTKVQPYAPYPAAEAAGRAMDESYAALAPLLGVAEDELHIGPSTSQNSYVLARAFRAGWEGGDEIIVTNQDHEANSGVWRRLAETGIVVREWRVNPETGHLDPADLEDLLSDRTRLVAFPHASNIVAEINPVAEICAKAHAAGAVCVVDGVSYAPHGLPDVNALEADIYLFSAYKTFGPHQGVMVARRALAERLENQGHYFNAGDIRKRLVPAGPDHAQVAALAGVAAYLNALSAHHGDADAHTLIRARETALIAPLMARIAGREDLRLLGPANPAARAPTLALACPLPGVEMARRMAQHRVMAGGGHFYAVRLLEGLGLDPAHGVLRLSAAHYTSPEEIEQASDALEAALR